MMNDFRENGKIPFMNILSLPFGTKINNFREIQKAVFPGLQKTTCKVLFSNFTGNPVKIKKPFCYERTCFFFRSFFCLFRVAKKA